MVGIEQPSGYNSGAYAADTSGRDEPTGRREIDWDDTNRNELYRSSPFDAVMADVVNGIGKGMEAYDAMVGGRGVRGALAGKPRELLSAIDPFGSDTSGLTNPSDRTTGRQLGESWGAIGKDEGLTGSLKGMGIDFLTNPGSGPTLAKIPTVAQNLGRIGLRAASSPFAKQFMADERGMLDPLLGLGQEFDEAGLGYKTAWSDVRDKIGNRGYRRIELAASDLARDMGMDTDSVLARIASEVHPDAVHLGGGVDAHAFRDPNGFVTRIGARDASTVGNPTRLGDPRAGMLQPFRANEHGRRIVVEQLPEVNTYGDAKRIIDGFKEGVEGITPEHAARARETMEPFYMAQDAIANQLPRGVSDVDLHYGNIGFHPNGVWSIIDPGAISADPKRAASIANSMLDYTSAADLPLGSSPLLSRLQSMLSRKLGEASRNFVPSHGFTIPDIDHNRLAKWIDDNNRLYRSFPGKPRYEMPINVTGIRRLGPTATTPTGRSPVIGSREPILSAFPVPDLGTSAFPRVTDLAKVPGQMPGVSPWTRTPMTSVPINTFNPPPSGSFPSAAAFGSPSSFRMPPPRVNEGTNSILRRALQQAQEASPVIDPDWLRRFQAGVLPGETPITRRF